MINAIFRGIATLLDWFGMLNVSIVEHDTPKEADGAALAADWQAIGSDLWDAIEEYEQFR